MMKELALAKVYALLEPGPVVLLTTARAGRANVMTMSWHMMVEFEPPRVACVVSGANYSFAALRATRECVIAIPAVKLARQVVGCTTKARSHEEEQPRITRIARIVGNRAREWRTLLSVPSV
jgi:flavin reductase (DIM6/NTAB) family NADH-FMN oxidoreductase RutF